MIKIFLSFLILTGVLAAQEILTAEDAIRIGLENNYEIRIARNNRQVADNNRGKGTAEFLPKLDVSANYQKGKAEQESNSPFSFGNTESESKNAQASLTWTLFDGFRMFASNRQFRELAELGEFQARNTIEFTVVRILVAYFNVVQQEELLDVARNALEISRTRLEKEKLKQELGSASSTDFLNAQVSFNNDKATLINQELRLLVAKKELNIFLARDVTTPLEVNKKINIPPLTQNVDELLELAMARNSTLSIAEQNRLIAEKSVSLSESSFYPRLQFGYTYGMAENTNESSRFEYPIETTNTEQMGRLSLTYNLFNGLRDRIDWQNARIAEKNSELSLMDVRNQIAGLVRERYVTMQKRLELMELEEQNVSAAQQNLDLQTDRYQIGAATFLEYRDAQINLIRAQSTLIVARFQSRISRLEIEQLIGNISID